MCEAFMVCSAEVVDINGLQVHSILEKGCLSVKKLLLCIEPSDFSFILIMFQHWYSIRKFLILKSALIRNRKRISVLTEGYLEFSLVKLWSLSLEILVVSNMQG